RDHLDLVVEDLALGRQDLNRELRVGHQSVSESSEASGSSDPSEASEASGSSDPSEASEASDSLEVSEPLSRPPESPPRESSPLASSRTSSIVPFMKKARSGRSSCLPWRISSKPRI